MKFSEDMDIKCEDKMKNLEEYPLGKHVEKISHWANLKYTPFFQSVLLVNRRVFFWIFNKKAKATITVEAACVVPIFVLAVSMLVGIFDCYRIQSVVKTSIHQSAMELGMYAYVQDGDDVEKKVVNSALCQVYAQSKLPKFDDNVSVSMLGSYYKDNQITLRATIKYSFPIALFPVPAIELVNVSEVYAWTGKNVQNQHLDRERCEYEMVYVTRNAKVYHTSSKCSHIDRKTYKDKKSKLEDKYRACEKCCEEQELKENKMVYYTKTGECYHSKKDCGSLKRVVRLVELAQVKHLSKCERCEKKEK